MSQGAIAVVRHPFWSDDFDMDLLKLFPDVPKMLHNPDRILWTVGHTSGGRLNHPTVWNSHGGFLWLKQPALERDQHGWFNINGCVGDSPLIECTWLEWLRDVWSHHMGALLMPQGVMLPTPPDNDFMTIMYDLRGWHKRDVSECRARALAWIARCDFKLTRIAEADTFGQGSPDGEPPQAEQKL